ncbi:hypothetical protein CRV24_004342 [Beauveria bassiana]|nr:hypothetical protein CRV24_004342 [Beauveria bassiana]
MQDHLQVTFGPSYRVNGLTTSSSLLLDDIALAAAIRQYQGNSTGNAHQSVQMTLLPGIKVSPSTSSVASPTARLQALVSYPADWAQD